ncbi:MFS transporter [Sabulicella rubraurantiaca]|uniref:MFS transporter n=1 Tax=Sabulicella rubraurantiaca TaxID=2811429 RepID=UPI001A96D010|nr:MFS transporter [Sabulicella rubraurantiaca]
MRALLSPISALLLSVAILIMGNGLQSTLLPVRASFEEFDPTEIGLQGSSYFLGFVVGCILGGRMIQRVGHIRTFAALASVASTVVLIHAMVVEPFTWAVLRAITGFCFAGLYLVIESWLNERAGNENRGMVMGVYTMINLGVIVIGQMMLTLSDPSRFPLFALASILVSLAAVPVALTGAAPPAPLAEARLRPLKLYRISPVGVVGAMMAGVASGAFWALGPAYVVAMGADTRQVAIFMSIAVLGGALIQWPIGRLSDRLDRRIVVIGACLVGAASGVGLVMGVDETGLPMALLAALFGAAAFPLYAICAAHAFDHTAPSDFVEASSGLLLANGLGAVAGPLLASVLMRISGPSGLFMATAVAHLLLAGFVAWRITRRAAMPKELRPDFDLAGTAPTMVAPQEEAAPAAAR